MKKNDRQNDFGTDMTKHPPIKKNALSRSNWQEAGQLSIFLGMALVVVTTFVAFVVNVGLFVKAKINLQNSVDAAAYAGASVQARQLTNIGYLNYEIRNVYKEWMFKYYVLGNIGLDSIDNITGNERTRSGGCPSGFPLNPGAMNFRLRQFKGVNCERHDPNLYDRFNVPTICIHFGSNNNICEISTLPGLPRFNTVGLPSISPQHEAFLNSIVQEKSNDCIRRSSVNMGATMLWTYGTGNPSLMGDVPSIASDRIGAWVKSLEIALRIRNLESIVNTPPTEDFVCQRAGSPSGCQTADSFLPTPGGAPGSSFPFLERFSKAYWTGFRNLSGGAFKEGGDGTDFAASWRLKELKPTVFEPLENSLSDFLIPVGSEARSKYYLDLKVVPVNYALFYTAFYTSNGNFDASTSAEAQCGGTKTAFPVPGYIMGFVKNPEVLTYYAVQGEADFTGLFYPFRDGDGITLKTYAAAKPFGGRIGPALFDASITTGGGSVSTRDLSPKSSNYISALVPPPSLNLATDAGVEKLLAGGYPMPTTQDFWVNPVGSSVVGGNPTSSETTSAFGVPNLIYDFTSYGDIENLGLGTPSSVFRLEEATNETLAYQSMPLTTASFGLYNINQFTMFAANKVASTAAVLDTAQIRQSIHNVRRATRYDALNYMVPFIDLNSNNALQIDGYSYLPETQQNLDNVDIDRGARGFRIFAPLYGPSALYDSPEAVMSIVNEYITQNTTAVNLYMEALETVAEGMRRLSTSTRDGAAYAEAADSVHTDITTLPPDRDGDGDVCDELSMAHKFNLFFSNATTPTCGITPIARLIADYFTNPPPSQGGPNFSTYYYGTWTPPTFAADPSDTPGMRSGMTAYAPGQRQGAESDGTVGSPFGDASSIFGKRNFYSTKFIPLDSVSSSGETIGTDSLPVFVDGSNSGFYTSTELFIGLGAIRNSLDNLETNEFGPNLRY